MSINNDNIVKIGVALKWRNTFDLTKKYYQENVVTACGCVFRCKVLQAQGKSPIKMTDDQGHIVYTNTDVWDVLVDMAYYYNYAVDTRKLTQQMLDYAKKLDEAFQKQQKEIEALQKDNRDQWNHINDIEKVNTEQQRELNSIFDTISCFSEGIWIDTLLWSNETIWDNNKYAITDDLQNQINVLDENHRQDIEDLTEKHNTEISALAAHVARQEKIQMGINEYLQDQVYDLNNSFSCFNTGVWENDLHWSQEALWDNNKYAITDALAADIKKLDEHLSKSDKAFEEAMLENAKEHGLVNTHLQKHDREMKDLQDLIKEHDEFKKEHQTITGRLDGLDTKQEGQQHEIDSLLYRISILTNGVWDNNLLWINESEWTNTNLNGSCHCPTDTEERLDELQAGLEATTQRISDAEENIKVIISDVEVNASVIADNADEIEIIKQNAVTEHQNVAYQLRAIRREQTAQDENITKIGEHFSCYADGIWGNLFIWDNDLLWANETGVITGAISDLRDDLRDTRYKLNEDIMTNLSLIQANNKLIQKNTSDIQDNKEAIEATQSELQDTSDEIRKEALTEHRQVAYQLRAIGREQTAQDDNIAKLGEHFGCFVDGVWGDLFIWNNDHLWANGAGVIDEAIADTNERIDVISEEIDNINQRAEDHQSEYQKMLDDIRAYNGCFEKGEWADPFFWNDTDIWYNSPNSISEAENDIISHNSRLTALESQFVLFIQQYTTQQTIIEQHQNQLETLMDCFTVLNVGKWQNLLLWDNTSKWSNALITEAAASVGTGGSSTVTVKSYDPDTATVTI